MNLAFPAFILFLLYLPGPIFLSAYYGKLSKERELTALSSSVTGKATLALLIALLGQLIWLSICSVLVFLFNKNLELHIDNVLILLAGHDNSEYKDALDWTAGHLPNLFFYIFSLYGTAWFTGSTFRKFIRTKGFDRKKEALRFPNKWHYALTGEVNQFPEYEIDCTAYADVVLEIGGKPYIYSGLIRDYWFDRDGNLEIVVLERAVRMTFEMADNPDLVEPVFIFGNQIYFKYSEILNINLSYVGGVTKV